MEYAAFRDWAVPALDLTPYPALHSARAWSLATLERLRAALGELSHTFPEVAAVGVSGSLGRLEAGPYSDADLLVVLYSHADPLSGRARDVMGLLWDVLARLGLSRPRPTGVFATPATTEDLGATDTLGLVAEELPVFGKRIQLLLDAQPVYNNAGFAAVQQAVVERYRVADAPYAEVGDIAGRWAYLLNDLGRYFRSLRVSEPYKAPHQAKFLRLVKLEHSRVLMYAGLLLLLGESTKGPCAEFVTRLPLTPLERVARVYADYADPQFARVAAAYERFLAVVNDADQRAQLAGGAAGQAPRGFAELLENAGRLQHELGRFVLARQADWRTGFFDRLLF